MEVAQDINIAHRDSKPYVMVVTLWWLRSNIPFHFKFCREHK